MTSLSYQKENQGVGIVHSTTRKQFYPSSESAKQDYVSQLLLQEQALKTSYLEKRMNESAGINARLDSESSHSTLAERTTLNRQLQARLALSIKENEQQLNKLSSARISEAELDKQIAQAQIDSQRVKQAVLLRQAEEQKAFQEFLEAEKKVVELRAELEMQRQLCFETEREIRKQLVPDPSSDHLENYEAALAQAEQENAHLKLQIEQTRSSIAETELEKSQVKKELALRQKELEEIREDSADSNEIERVKMEIIELRKEIEATEFENERLIKILNDDKL